VKTKTENLNFDNELLKPIKTKLESSIDTLTKNAILTGKEAEITLKINISVTKKDREFNDEIQEYLQPNYDYQIAEKIKEAKGTYKGFVGFNYAITINDNSELIVQDINEQQKLF
jgi:metal-dependent amidase/aminoacylase/carboxypeptidase family protein